LLRHPEEGRALGAKGCEAVRERFLLMRLIADELYLYSSLLGVQAEMLARGEGGTGG
jgi:hypothetical protein